MSEDTNGFGPGYPKSSDDLSRAEPPEDDGFEGSSGFSPMPRTVGDYQLVSRVGGGSMADLYIGRKVSQYGFVHRAIIKQVKRSRSDFRQLQGMLLDEARATACFDHPNLVKIYDVGETEHGLYLALEYVEGTDLRRVNQKLRTRKEALPFELACFIVSEVLRGVHHAHTAQGPDGQHLEIVHRDVNPSNILVANSGHVKLADFGVVRMRERIQPRTEPGLLKGKYAYLAPEYIAGEACSVQTDVYAAGIMLFELLSGRECFTGSSAYEVMWKIVNKGVPMYRLQREGVPEDLQRLVARATSMVPERRYASAQDMANALEAWLMRSQKHATPWVLSVFFHRHDLFRQPLDPSFQPLAQRTPTPAAEAETSGGS
ncbi:MAG: serine/threonine-protein kinase, partial [Myxococcota bacterium]